MPTDLHPTGAAWLREQVRQEVEHRIAPLRRELDGLDDWTNGVFAALLDLLLPVLEAHPELAPTLEALGKQAARQLAALERDAGRSAATPDQLEARRMVSWLLSQLGRWPSRKRRRSRRKPGS